jgi:hypothetical protein
VVRVSGYNPEVQVQFPTLPDFLRSSESGTESTQPLSTIEELLERKVAALVYKADNMAIGICHADNVATSICKNWY